MNNLTLRSFQSCFKRQRDLLLKSLPPDVEKVISDAGLVI